MTWRGLRREWGGHVLDPGRRVGKRLAVEQMMSGGRGTLMLLGLSLYIPTKEGVES